MKLREMWLRRDPMQASKGETKKMKTNEKKRSEKWREIKATLSFHQWLILY